MKQIPKLLYFILIVATVSCNNSIDEPEITIAELQEHINYLASDELQGRLPGSPGDLSSAEYIRDLLGSWGLQEAVDDGLQRFEIDAGIKSDSGLTKEKVISHNILMILPGNDPELMKEYIVIGGHYDHLGLGGEETSSRLIDSVGVHYGADDNASGIASMLEIAEKFAASANNSRSILFAGFAAEEMGLLGSKYLVENLPIDSSCINAMINLDMVGRLKESNILQIGGVGTAVEFESIIKANTDTGIIKLALSEEGYGPSDHSSFYLKNIPVLFISTGAHLDYHTPYDTPEKLNYEGLVIISEMVSRIAAQLTNDTARVVFKEAGPSAQSNIGLDRKGVSLGIMPDYAGAEKNGMRADFIIPGRPAALGGMQKGDIITAINGLKINNIQDYMLRLTKLKHGETINIEILRDGKKELLLVTL